MLDQKVSRQRYDTKCIDCDSIIVLGLKYTMWTSTLGTQYIENIFVIPPDQKIKSIPKYLSPDVKCVEIFDDDDIMAYRYKENDKSPLISDTDDNMSFTASSDDSDTD